MGFVIRVHHRLDNVLRNQGSRPGADRLGLRDIASILCSLQLGELADGNNGGHPLAIPGEIGDLSSLGLGERISNGADWFAGPELMNVRTGHA